MKSLNALNSQNYIEKKIIKIIKPDNTQNKRKIIKLPEKQKKNPTRWKYYRCFVNTLFSKARS